VWEESERIQSSTWRELVVVERVLCPLVSILEGESITRFTNNINVVCIVRKGSMKRNLQDVAMKIFHICLENNIRLK
jgi:hypothetical protein